MAEYIEKQAVMDKFSEIVAPSCHSDFQRAPTWNKAVDIVQNFPPADVRPVVRGRWEEVDEEDTWRCSACGILWTFIEGTPTDNDTFFCPNCGADMRTGG